MTDFLRAIAILPITAWHRWCEWRAYRREEQRMTLSERWREERLRLRMD